MEQRSRPLRRLIMYVSHRGLGTRTGTKKRNHRSRSNHRSSVIESIVDGLTHFTTLDALEATLAGFLAQEAAAQGGDTIEQKH